MSQCAARVEKVYYPKTVSVHSAFTISQLCALKKHPLFFHATYPSYCPIRHIWQPGRDPTVRWFRGYPRPWIGNVAVDSVDVNLQVAAGSLSHMQPIFRSTVRLCLSCPRPYVQCLTQHWAHTVDTPQIHTNLLYEWEINFYSVILFHGWMYLIPNFSLLWPRDLLCMSNAKHKSSWLKKQLC